MCGLNSKLKNGVFEDYTANFDILCLSETKSKDGPIIKDFTCYDMTKKSKKYPYPGIHGIQVYISRRINELIEQVTDIILSCESVLWIKVKNVMLLGAVYIPHESSKYYYREMFDDLAMDIK